MFSVFESWYIRQHRDVAKLPAEWMEKTFVTTTFANGFLAIVAGVVANLLADNLGYGPQVSFVLTIKFFTNNNFSFRVIDDIDLGYEYFYIYIITTGPVWTCHCVFPVLFYHCNICMGREFWKSGNGFDIIIQGRASTDYFKSKDTPSWSHSKYN
jgi:hypothetical protein